jgi:hypothetical protein
MGGMGLKGDGAGRAVGGEEERDSWAFKKASSHRQPVEREEEREGDEEGRYADRGKGGQEGREGTQRFETRIWMRARDGREAVEESLCFSLEHSGFWIEGDTLEHIGSRIRSTTS